MTPDRDGKLTLQGFSYVREEDIPEKYRARFKNALAEEGIEFLPWLFYIGVKKAFSFFLECLVKIVYLD